MHLDPKEAFDHLVESTKKGIAANFPVTAAGKTLHVENLEVESPLHPDDIRSQYKAKMGGATWSSPMMGTVVLKDAATGKELQRKRTKIADVPTMTRRYSYIINGQEYQVDGQQQLKPGVYARRRNNGELEGRFNVANATAFDMLFDPSSKVFKVNLKKAKIPAYGLLKAMGVSDEQMMHQWGEDVWKANKNVARADGAVDQFYRTLIGKAPDSHEQAVAKLKEHMERSELTPEVTEVTLGKPFKHVTGEALLLAGDKILKVQAGHPEDDRDNLQFKSFRTTGDFVQAQLEQNRKLAALKLQRQMASANFGGIRDLNIHGTLSAPIRQFFVKSSISNVAKQINALEMVSAARNITIMGPGGIQGENSITDEAKMVNPSHMGVLDGLHTPEGGRTGVTQRMAAGAEYLGDGKVGIPVYDKETGKMTHLSVKDFFKSKVVLPDQVTFDDKGKPTPVHKEVKIAGTGNDIEVTKYEDARYVMRHPSQMFSLTTNLIPFLGSDSGNRASMAARHQEQAISLVNREVPLVQTATPALTGKYGTFEKLIGMQAAHTSPVSGTVTRIEKDGIHIKDSKGVEHEVQLYNHFPLNDTKSSLNSTPLSSIKVGSKVSAGDVVADTNYSKDGQLALGRSMRIAFVPYKGYNFEDGIVVSESAAKKLSSEHMHKHDFQTNEKVVHDPKFFKIQHAGVYTPDQMDKLGDNGVVRVGQEVRPGDPLILATQPYDAKHRSSAGALAKSMRNQHTDRTVRWEGEHVGQVVAVHKNGDNISVHVRTIEPLEVGDKLSARHGNKGIVSRVLPDDQMPHDKDGKPVEVLLNPMGLPGRMNVGQLLETAAGKIAQKTGKPYVVNNFDAKIDDMHAHVVKQLKEHGLSETEELFDPISKKSLGAVTTGPQYMIKLVHQVSKKSQARSGMGLPGMTSEERVDTNTLQPASGGHHGGQSTGALGVFGLLAHGATANLREMQTLKSEAEDPETDPLKKWQSQHNATWTAIQQGQPIPVPKSTYAFHRFTEMLKGAGINVEKKGHEMILGPLTDKDVLKMSRGEITNPTRIVEAKIDPVTQTYKTIKGGLFDDKVTGGHGGTNWSHIKLAEPVPNPVFEGAIQRLLGLKGKDYDAIVSGTVSVDDKGKMSTDLSKGLTGGHAIKSMLSKIDVERDLAEAKKSLQGAKPADVDKALKKVKYLKSLQALGLKADEAYVLHNLPVIPPKFRPITKMQEGVLKFEDMNGLYDKFGQVNSQLANPVLAQNLTDADKAQFRAALYDGVKALTGVAAPVKDDDPKGLLEQIAGKSPKQSYFQDTLVARRQDASMRTTIVPEPSLSLDQIGLPKHEAFRVYMPFVVRQMVQNGSAASPLSAQKILSEHLRGVRHDKAADIALQMVMDTRPILVKRDPVLHKYGIQAAKPVLVEGNAVKLHPLTCGGFNADFDGDHHLGRVVVFIATRIMQKALSDNEALPDSATPVWPSSTWWRDRRLPERLQNFYRNETHADSGSFYVLDLSEVPHVEGGVVTPGGTSVHAVPYEMHVISWDEGLGRAVLAPIRYWSKHTAKPVQMVRLRSGRTVFTDDDPRAVYGKLRNGGADPIMKDDPHSALHAEVVEKDGVLCTPYVRRRPAEAELDVPTLNPDFVGGQFEGATFVALPCEEDPSLNIRMELTRSRGYFVGSLVAVGYITGSDPDNQQLHIAKERRPDTGWLCNTVGQLFLCSDVAERQTLHTLSIPSAPLRDTFIQWIGRDSTDRHLPPFVFYAPREFQVGLLHAVLVHLAHVEGPRLWLRLPNVRMVYEVQELCRQLGIRSTPDGRGSMWRLSIPAEDLYEYAPELDAELTKRQLRDSGVANVGIPEAEAPSGLDPVEFYQPTNHGAVGYDLTVPGYETFMDSQGVFRSNTMAAFVPFTDEAVQEAYKMLPSKNILSDASGNVMFIPTLESALGIYKLSRVGKDTGKSYKDYATLLKDVDAKKASITDVVTVGGKKTTAGRVLLAEVAPPKLRDKFLTDFSMTLDKKGLYGVLNGMAKEDTANFAKHVDALKDLGNAASFGVIKTNHLPEPLAIGTTTLTLKDFTPDKATRQAELATAEKAIQGIRQQKDISSGERSRRIVQEYLKADERIFKNHSALESSSANPSSLFMMQAAGTKPDKNQYKQMRLAPMVLKDSKNNFIEQPVKRSYAEGLDTAGYWTQGHGARRGSVMKVQEVQEPGYMTKLLQATSMHLLVDQPDCGTKSGVLLSAQSPDVHDRHLAQPLKVGKTTYDAGTILTPHIIGEIRAVDPNAKILVRSPLRCDSDKGICKVCAGLDSNGQHYHIGTNIGVLSSHAVGERAVQLTLKSFHSGGVAELGGGNKALNSFARFEQLMNLNKTIPDAATLAKVSGKVEKVEHDRTGVRVTVGGHTHFIGKDANGQSLHEDLPGASAFKDYKVWQPPKVGQVVKAGDTLSDPNRTTINPHDLYAATGSMAVVQSHLADEIHNLYKEEGVKRRAVETLVRAMSNVSRVEDAGDNPDILRGEYYPTSYLNSLNKGAAKPVVHAPILKGITTLPFMVHDDWMGHLQHQRLKGTLTEGAATRAVSNIHGTHPIPAVAYGAEVGKPNLARPIPGRPFNVKPHNY